IGVGRTYEIERSICFGNVESEARFTQISTRIFLAFEVLQVQSPELRLRVCENVFHRRELKNVLREARTKGEALAPIHHFSTHAKSYCSYSVLSSRWHYWVEIVRAYHS